jgi:hypothetical protein
MSTNLEWKKMAIVLRCWTKNATSFIVCLVGCVVFCLSALPVRAATINAASCSRPDVQAAIDQAQDGDTVEVPAGSATWSTAVTIANKAITLRGAGSELTVITDAGTSCMELSGGTGKAFRITGFGFVGTGNSGSTSISLSSGSWIGFRIDHCRFFNERHAARIQAGVKAEGVMDHCQYYCLENKGSGDHVAVRVYGDHQRSWNEPIAAGTSHALVIEDCYFEYSLTVDVDRPYVASIGAGRSVFRYSRGVNGVFEIFGLVDAYTGKRGNTSFEAYHNQLSGSCYGLFIIQSGAINIFNNDVTGNYGNRNIELSNRRSSGATPPLQYSMCDGTKSLDGNAVIESGTHSGGNNQSVLMAAGKSWSVDQWAGYAVWNASDNSVGLITGNTSDTISVTGLVEGYTAVDSGTVTSHSGQQMTCTGKTWQWGGFSHLLYVYNLTDGSHGRITANGASTVTAALSGGIRNSWQVGDQFQITQGVPQAGIEKDWDTGDSFFITNGYPCLDQVGRGQDAGGGSLHPQVAYPLYAWGNTLNGAAMNPTVANLGVHPHAVADHIQINRDYYAGVPRPRYVPYVYPHPLTLSDHPGQQRSLDLTGTGGDGSASLSWQFVTGAASYRILRDWQLAAGVTASSWADAPVVGEHVYMVYALDAAGTVLAAEGALVGVGPQPATRFVSVPPCRVLDTRISSGAGAAAPILAAHERRVFTIAGACGVPAVAQAVSANLTVVNAQALGDLRVVGGHIVTTNTSALSIPLARARANNAIVQLSTSSDGTIAVTNDSSGEAHFILDVNGYFQ